MAKNQAYPQEAQQALAELQKYNEAQGGRIGGAKFTRTVRKDRTKINLQSGDIFVFPTFEEITKNSVELPIANSKQKAEVFPIYCENCKTAKNLNPNAFGRGAVLYDEETKQVVKDPSTGNPAPEVNWVHDSEFAKIWESAGNISEALKAVAGFKVRVKTTMVYTYNRFNNTYGYTTVIESVDILDKGIDETAPAAEETSDHE